MDTDDKLHQYSAEHDNKLHNEPQPPKEPENQPNKPSEENDKSDFSVVSWMICGLATFVSYILFFFLNHYIASIIGFNILFLHIGFCLIFLTISGLADDMGHRKHWVCIFLSMGFANLFLAFSSMRYPF